MRGWDVFCLNIFQDQFNKIMELQPKDRVDQAQKLKKDMEAVFMIPHERKYPEVFELYEKVSVMIGDN